ncbi:Serine/threonine-protein kinase PLK1, partial [Bos mutus]
GFHSFFEDVNFMLVMLGLCCWRSVLELHQWRKSISQDETRCYLRQIVLESASESEVVHQDLKLGRVFLNEDLEVKIGDL